MTPFTEQEMQRLEYLIVNGLVFFQTKTSHGWKIPTWHGLNRTNMYDDHPLIARCMQLMLSK